MLTCMSILVMIDFSTKAVPWYFTGMTTMINLHIHNHNTMALKILWAIWDIVLIIGIVTGLMMTIIRKYKIQM